MAGHQLSSFIRSEASGPTTHCNRIPPRATYLAPFKDGHFFILFLKLNIQYFYGESHSTLASTDQWRYCYYTHLSKVCQFSNCGYIKDFLPRRLLRRLIALRSLWLAWWRHFQPYFIIYWAGIAITWKFEIIVARDWKLETTNKWQKSTKISKQF